MSLKGLDNDCEFIIALCGKSVRCCMEIHHRVGAPGEQSLENGLSQNPKKSNRDYIVGHPTPDTACSLVENQILQTLS